MNDEGLADARAANPFSLSGLHPGIGLSVASVPGVRVLALTLEHDCVMFDKHDVIQRTAV